MSTESQPGLFKAESPSVKLAYLEGRLREAKDPDEREQLLAQLRELEPAGFWNGHVFATDNDVGF